MLEPEGRLEVRLACACGERWEESRPRAEGCEFGRLVCVRGRDDVVVLFVLPRVVGRKKVEWVHHS